MRERSVQLLLGSLVMVLVACSGGGKTSDAVSDQSTVDVADDGVITNDSGSDSLFDLLMDVAGADQTQDTISDTGSLDVPGDTNSDAAEVVSDSAGDSEGDLQVDVDSGAEGDLTAETDTQSCDDNIASTESTVEAADPLVLGQKVALNGSLAICPAGQVDWFKLVVGGGDPLGHYILDFAGTTGQSGIFMRVAAKRDTPGGADVVVVSRDVSLAAPTKVALIAVDAPGTYYISVTAINLPNGSTPALQPSYNFVPSAPCVAGTVGDDLCKSVYSFLPGIACRGGYCSQCGDDNDCTNASCLKNFGLCGCLVANGNQDCFNNTSCSAIDTTIGVCQ